MSATTQETAGRNRNRHEAPPVAHTNGQEAPTAPAAPQVTGAIEMEIDGYGEVPLARKFIAGMVMTEDHAFQLDTFYARQFRSNQNAMTANRAKALEKATTDTDRDKAQTAISAATKDALLKIWADYAPNVGNVKVPNAEKVRHEAAKRYWSALVARHNKSIMSAIGADGKYAGTPVITKAGMSVVALPKATETDGVKITAADHWSNLTTRLLTMPDHAAAIQEHIDAINAENGKAKETAKAEATTVTSDSLL